MSVSIYMHGIPVEQFILMEAGLSGVHEQSVYSLDPETFQPVVLYSMVGHITADGQTVSLFSTYYKTPRKTQQV